MSYIAFTTGPDTFRISGTERAHMGLVIRQLAALTDPPKNDAERFDAQIREALRNQPACRLVARMHGQCELGAWVRPENARWLAGLIRDACETTVRVPSADGGTERAELLRVGFSAYGRADLNHRGDECGPLQTWWSLTEWLESPHAGARVAMYYSTSGVPWPDPITRGSAYLDGWLKANVPHLEWTPAGWDGWEP